MAKNIPPNAVAMLFVDDLMQYLLNRHALIHYEPEKAEPYRKHILNAFNMDVKIAVNFIDISVESEVEEHFCELEELNEKSFIDYALHCEDISFKKGFQADCFLEYCVRLVSMAVHFTRHNVSETINITRNIILKLIEDRDDFEGGGWEAVIEAAKKYATIYIDCCNTMTPDTSDDEYVVPVSEDKPPAYSPEDKPPAYSPEDKPPAYSPEDEPPVYSSEDEPPGYSSADSLDMSEEKKDCDYVSNREQLHKPEREFETDLSAARESLQPERSSNSATNADFNSGQTSEGTSSTYEL